MFQKSSYSGIGQNCAEVADLPCGAVVRNSKHTTAGPLPSHSEVGCLPRPVRIRQP
ncbi:DUF397 domain-containing protein [Nocardiopsis sp. NPDC006139]|uniref:DUF397 domain-containing protein n=1 Tax=Nocardiopsis sp. NPDC006139 TaxID=3154578 RepID=UPI0033AE1131